MNKAERLKLAKERLDALDGLPEYQLRKVLDYLYDGYIPVASILLEIRGLYHTKTNTHREHSIYMWLAKNRLRGQKLQEFIHEEGGVLNAVVKITNYLDNASKKKLNLNEVY